MSASKYFVQLKINTPCLIFHTFSHSVPFMLNSSGLNSIMIVHLYLCGTFQLTCDKTDFLPYVMEEDGRCVITDVSLADSMKAKTNGSSASGGGGEKGEGKGLANNTLASRLKRILKELEHSHRTHIKEKFLADLRKAREQTKADELDTVRTTMISIRRSNHFYK